MRDNRSPAYESVLVLVLVLVLVCSADGSTHTESNKLYRKVKHRARPTRFHANGQSAPRSGGARDVGRSAGSHTPSTASELPVLVFQALLVFLLPGSRRCCGKIRSALYLRKDVSPVYVSVLVLVLVLLSTSTSTRFPFFLNG